MTVVLLTKKKYRYLNKFSVLPFLDIFQKRASKTIIAYFGDQKVVQYNSMISLCGFPDYDSLFAFTQTIDQPFFITSEEGMVDVMHRLMYDSGQIHSDNYALFTDKGLERKLMAAIDPQTTPIIYGTGPALFDLDKIHTYTFPAMYKPMFGAAGKGIHKVSTVDDLLTLKKNLPDTVLQEGRFLLEEYVFGKQYAVTYFVDKEQGIHMGVPTYIVPMSDVGLPSSGNLARFISKGVYEELDMDKVYHLAEVAIRTGGLRNTYVHHEFRVTDTGLYKTIELNGRIGGYRLDMNLLSAHYNLFELYYEAQSQKCLPILNNVCVISVYATRDKVVYQGFDKELSIQIKNLPSLYRFSKKNSWIGKEVGFTQDGFDPIGTIILVYDDYDQLVTDYEFIKNNYDRLLVLEDL